MAEESTSESTAVESAPETTQESSPSTYGGEAIDAKLQSMQNGGQDEGGEVEGSEVEGKSDKPVAEKEAEESKSPFSEDMQKFIQSKGLDLNNLQPEKLIDMYMNAEKRMNDALREKDLFAKSVEQKQIQKAADKVLSAGQEDAPQKLSPLQSVDQDYNNALQNLMHLHGVNDVNDMYGDPVMSQAIANLNSIYNDAREEALLAEVDWRFQQREESEQQKSSEQAIREEYEKVKEIAQGRMAEYEKAHPEIMNDFVKYGANDFVEYLSKTTNVPVEYFAAAEPFLKFLVDSTNAMKQLEGLPERDGKIKSDIEKGIARAKGAEMASPTENLPDDHTVAFKLRSLGNRNGVSMFD